MENVNKRNIEAIASRLNQEIKDNATLRQRVQSLEDQLAMLKLQQDNLLRDFQQLQAMNRGFGPTAR